nr:MAG TPA: hypothetical protein [Caudoviricetes sp.]
MSGVVKSTASPAYSWYQAAACSTFGTSMSTLSIRMGRITVVWPP